MASIIEIVLPTFATMGVGYVFGRLSNVDLRSVIDVAMYITLPALAFTSMLDKPIILGEAAKLWAAAVFVALGSYALAWVFFRITRQQHSGLYLAIIFMNSVNIPFPIIYLAFGAEGLAVATLFYIPNALLIYTWGVHIAYRAENWKDSVKEVLRVPLIYGAVGGLIFNLAHVQPPALIMGTLEFIGQAAIPLVLIVAGVDIAGIRPTAWPTAITAGAIRMGGGFLLGVAAAVLFRFTGVARAVVIFDAAMPTAVFASILCAKYRNESELVSSVVLITTVASVVTVPLLLYFLR
ncbi:MAG: AEC family transporter [Actinobacteria bacterium]|nr:AEC family transporter [Actinomycetota bacterium]